MTQKITHDAVVGEHQFGMRFDQVLAELFPDYSRSRLKEWILAGQVSLDGEVIRKPREKVLPGMSVRLDAEIVPEERYTAQDIELDVVFEDDDILVINKPAGLVVHPGAGMPDGTILNALLHRYPAASALARAGIVHRLDKDTTGLMVIAKTIAAQTHLVTALQARQITREYEAIVNGVMTAGGLVDEPIGRHPTKRTHMAVIHSGKPALTHYRVAERFRLHSRLRLRLESGRTHQIRVHMAHIRHPLVGDVQYGGRPRPPQGADERLLDALRNFKRQALHAVRLELHHPVSGEWLSWEAPVPDDMIEITELLRKDTYEDQHDHHSKT